MTAVSNKIHWLAPTTIVLSLLVGTAFAVGHHLFYWNLDGDTAQNDNVYVLGTSVSRQQLNIAGGTAFAFIVKAALTTAVSIAYVQLLWRNLTRSSSQAATLCTFNNLFAVFNNGFLLGKVWIWWRYPLLFCLAATAWLIPIASIITPATLSVINVPVTPPEARLINTPTIDFSNLNYVDNMNPPVYSPNQGTPSLQNTSVQYSYTGPSRAVMRVVQAVTASGDILAVNPPRANTTWQLSFAGPALKCGNLTAPERQHVLWNIANATGLNIATSPSNCSASGYTAWTGDGNVLNGSVALPYLESTSRSHNTTVTSYSYSGTGLSSALDFYMAMMPGVMDVISLGDTSHEQACGTLQNPDPTVYFPASTVLHCQLHNATYHLDFDYTVSEPNVRLVDLELHQRPLGPRVDFVNGPAVKPTGDHTKADCSILNSIGNVCDFNVTLLNTLSYQAVLEAFTNVTLGIVYNPQLTAAIFETSIQNTPLLNTKELAFLNDPVVVSSIFSSGSLQDAAQESNGTLMHGLASNNTLHSTVSLVDATEKLFRNVVISMISSEQLQPNPQSAFYPPAANVSFHDSHNVYAYSASKLWIAYGLAIFFASLASISGFAILLINRASYSNDFSSLVLFGRGANLSATPNEGDMRGRDPLPRYLAKARIWLSSAVIGQMAGYGVQNSRGDVKTASVQRPLLAEGVPDPPPSTRQML